MVGSGIPPDIHSYDAHAALRVGRDRELVGNATIADPRSQPIRASRRGGQITTSNSRFMSVRRAARTCVLPVDPRPDQRKLSASRQFENGGTAVIMPDNAFIEAFSGRFRAACLNAHCFASLPDPRRKPEDAQVLQRRTPASGDRPKDADYVAESLWRSQPVTVSKPEKSSRRRSNVRPQRKGRKIYPPAVQRSVSPQKC